MSEKRDVCLPAGAQDASCCHGPELGKFDRAANIHNSEVRTLPRHGTS